MLQKIVTYLQNNWIEQEEKLQREMQREGLAYERASCVPAADKLSQTDLQSTILLTDDQRLAAEWKRCGGICVGCIQTDGFFEGAELVTDRLEALERITLEETLLHGIGLPVTIAETDRLMIREIAAHEVETLYQMSLQKEMEYLWQQENSFLPERMLSYIKTVYRFCGYGLWSVWTKDGKLIGCCGFADFDNLPEQFLEESVPEENGQETAGAEQAVFRLELQYMLMPEVWRQGYGLEMCKAALAYIYERTDCDEVWVRIHRKNTASKRLAEKLGFVRCYYDCDAEIEFWKKSEKSS